MFSGDKGPEVFYEVQQNVMQTLEDKYYQPFIISDYYKHMLAALENEEGITEVDHCGSVEDQPPSGDSLNNGDCGLNVGDHSNYARRKLDQLQEKLNNKMQVQLFTKNSFRTQLLINLSLSAHLTLINWC